jgi:hypothetical protein
MRKLKFTCLLLFFSPFFALSQTQVKFKKVFSGTGYDYGNSAKQTNDKGYIIGGSTSTSGNGASDMHVMKTDSLGNPYLFKTFGGINIDRGYCIRQTSDNGYILLGYTNSFGLGGYDFYLVKMDSLLNEQWSKTYGGSDWDFGNCIEPTSDGGYIMCGSTYSFGSGDQDYYLIKINSIGDTLWTKTYGGTKEDVAKSVIQTHDGGYLLTGSTKSLGDTLGDIYTIKTDSFGDTLWTNRYSGSLADYGNDIVESINGGFLVGGETYSVGYGNADGLIMQLDSIGGFVRYRTIGGIDFDNITSITEDSVGRIGMIGNTFSFDAGDGDFYFFIFNSDFNYGGATYGKYESELASSVETTADGSFIICGTTTSFNNGLEDIYLIKTDTAGACGAFGGESMFIISVEDEAPLENSQFLLFPNPSNDMVSIMLNSPNNLQQNEITITDYLGRTIKTTQSNSFPFAISTEQLPNGMYYITLKNEEAVSTRKLVVQH